MKQKRTWYIRDRLSKAWRQIKDDISYPTFIILFCSLIIFVVWAVKFQSNHKLKHAARTALLAFFIAYLGHMDLMFTAAIFAFLIVMFTDINDCI